MASTIKLSLQSEEINTFRLLLSNFVPSPQASARRRQCHVGRPADLHLKLQDRSFHKSQRLIDSTMGCFQFSQAYVSPARRGNTMAPK